ncbi:MAG: NifB/NifX family molybdenum-iron cluster-binding protein [Massilibacteroides sp.]|nr:NifB/NifX family molybdenum-iron cluster-binding protein [Massilibacteroides sp.]MDD3063523.1 NifB/NifX family molybdenum-iron cluster-binding protein [Massilibacteroides sp.]MDD4115335.1 NifB/NifX family molybdenum-iron cluster-binding protein [Massilibacteroides sp.]MDD4660767.1 NifB/NifX family molybdenum-iron cluster-binding protein [Massilibacteroides sp.]
MKIAITSEGDTLSSNIDQRFGRCSFFAVYDTQTDKTTFSPNPARNAPEGAGPAAVQFIASQKVEKVVSGEFGGKIKTLLDSLHIEMHNEKEKTVFEIIQQFKKRR